MFDTSLARKSLRFFAYLSSFSLGLGLMLFILLDSPARALDPGAPATRFADTRKTTREITRLFGEEVQQATTKLKWHGERLTEDTIYAIALTGVSWEPAWGKDHLFSLAWGDLHKVPTLGKRKRDYSALVTEIQSRSDS